jgi:hypothetical protein
MITAADRLGLNRAPRDRHELILRGDRQPALLELVRDLVDGLSQVVHEIDIGHGDGLVENGCRGDPPHEYPGVPDRSIQRLYQPGHPTY